MIPQLFFVILVSTIIDAQYSSFSTNQKSQFTSNIPSQLIANNFNAQKPELLPSMQSFSSQSTESRIPQFMLSGSQTVQPQNQMLPLVQQISQVLPTVGQPLPTQFQSQIPQFLISSGQTAQMQTPSQTPQSSSGTQLPLFNTQSQFQSPIPQTLLSGDNAFQQLPTQIPLNLLSGGLSQSSQFPTQIPASLLATCQTCQPSNPQQFPTQIPQSLLSGVSSSQSLFTPLAQTNQVLQPNLQTSQFQTPLLTQQNQKEGQLVSNQNLVSPLPQMNLLGNMANNFQANTPLSTSNEMFQQNGFAQQQQTPTGYAGPITTFAQNGQQMPVAINQF
jgi:hypothetical protein